MRGNYEKCLGLTPQSTNEQVRRAAFDFAQRIGYMAFSSVATDGKTPTSRGLEVHYLDDAGNLYVGASHGKHFYDEMEKSPVVCGVVIDTVAVRITARLKKVYDKPLYDRYWELNPGTKKMYRKDHSNFQLYLLESGEGEVFHVYEDDAIARRRFSFGGGTPRPWTYTVTQACTGCGACAENCMMDTISMKDGVAVIEHYGCNECGMCRETCPSGAILKSE